MLLQFVFLAVASFLASFHNVGKFERSSLKLIIDHDDRRPMIGRPSCGNDEFLRQKRRLVADQVHIKDLCGYTIRSLVVFQGERDPVAIVTVE